MSKRKFTEAEVKSLIWEAEVESIQHDSGRWEAYMETIVQTEDGKYYSLNWGKGLTECQDNTFYEQEADEVELKEFVETVKRWVSVE